MDMRLRKAAAKGEIYGDLYFDEYSKNGDVNGSDRIDYVDITQSHNLKEEVMKSGLLCVDSGEYCTNCNSCGVVEPDIFDYAEAAKITREEAAEMIEEAARIIANVEDISQKRCNLQVLSAFIEIGRDWHIESAEEKTEAEGKNANWELAPDDIPF